MQRRMVRSRRADEPQAEYELTLPATHGAFSYLQERLEKQGALLATPKEVTNRRTDDPIKAGTVVIAHPDEREARYGKPLAVWDYDGKTVPMLYMGMGTEHAEKIIEHIQELRHYREDLIDRTDPDLARTDIKADHVDALDQYKRRLQGRRTYGSMK